MIEPVHPFHEVLDAASKLPVDEQQALIEILRRRVAEEGRRRIVGEIDEAEEAYSDGDFSAGSVQDLMSEIDREP